MLCLCSAASTSVQLEDENVELAQKLTQGKEEKDNYDIQATKLHDALDEASVVIIYMYVSNA
jgi:hypothetical protein